MKDEQQERAEEEEVTNSETPAHMEFNDGEENDEEDMTALSNERPEKDSNQDEQFDSTTKGSSGQKLPDATSATIIQ